MAQCFTFPLMNLIEKEISTITPSDAPTVAPLMRNKVVKVDAMAELQSLQKPATITTYARLADHFTNQLFQKYSNSDEVHLVFDRYDLALSLKSAATKQRRGDQDPAYYRITDSTHTGKGPMKRLLSHGATKK